MELLVLPAFPGLGRVVLGAGLPGGRAPAPAVGKSPADPRGGRRAVVQGARCPVVVVPTGVVPVDERARSGRRAATADGEPLPPRRRRPPG
jgi:hypothetical protein